MILKNPTDTEVSITVKGITKTIAPFGTIEVSQEFGNAWLSVHKFLQSDSLEVSVDQEETVEEELEIEEESVEVKEEVKSKVSKKSKK